MHTLFVIRVKKKNWGFFWPRNNVDFFNNLSSRCSEKPIFAAFMTFWPFPSRFLFIEDAQLSLLSRANFEKKLSWTLDLSGSYVFVYFIGSRLIFIQKHFENSMFLCRFNLNFNSGFVIQKGAYFSGEKLQKQKKPRKSRFSVRWVEIKWNCQTQNVLENYALDRSTYVRTRARKSAHLELVATAATAFLKFFLQFFLNFVACPLFLNECKVERVRKRGRKNEIFFATIRSFSDLIWINDFDCCGCMRTCVRMYMRALMIYECPPERAKATRSSEMPHKWFLYR